MQTYSDTPHPEGGIPPAARFPLNARPTIRPDHIDGPLLTFRDGQMHWLTLWERLLLALGLTDAQKLERKRRPNLMRQVARESWDEFL
jgi:hypothetical protein